MISIIIPTLNEAENIARLLPYLKKCCEGDEYEIIVSDCGSTDGTGNIAEKIGATVVLSSCKGRAMQMNSGAAVAQYPVLYFIHADTIPPASFCGDISNAIKKGYELGRYTTKFDSRKWILKLNAFFTKFDWFVCYGGDQTMFVTKKLFTQLNGFDSNMLIMEEYDFVKRARQISRYKIFKKPTLISARKYENNSWWKVQRANYTAVKMYKKKFPQTEIANQYRQLLNIQNSSK